MSALWTHRDAAKATGGRAVGTWSVGALSIDTRSLGQGDLFVPLKDIRDGHDFIPMAYAKGAGAVISEHAIEDAPALIVNDSLKALEDLAVAARKRSDAKRIAVTGSVGKTSVKEMIAHICRAAGNTHASIKSFNNHWGVPLTLAGMPQNTKYGVFEMGMNHEGELLALTQIVRPHIAIITKIAPAHLAHFKSVEAIANAKAEIFSGTVSGGKGRGAASNSITSSSGIAILPADSPYLTQLSDLAKTRNDIYSFGVDEKADARIVKSVHTVQGSVSTLEVLGESVEVTLPFAGTHWVENAACALLASTLAGVDLGLVITTLKNMNKIQGRGEVHSLVLGGKKLTLIDESYNANPESMRAAIASLGLAQGRKIAVLGDMLELGDTEKQLHAGLADILEKHDVDLVLTCGALMKSLRAVLPKPMDGGWYKNSDDCLAGLKSAVRDGDTVMIKGSNSSGMGKLVSTLKNNNNKKGNANVL